MPPLSLTRDELLALATAAGLGALDEVRLIAYGELVQQEIAIRVLVDLQRKPPGVARGLEPVRPVSRCQAVQHSDQMLCGRCGLGWDVNDIDPPKCAPAERRISLRRNGDA